MSAFRDIMSIVGPGGAKTTTAPKSGQSQPTGASKPTPRPAAGTNGTTPAPQLKRKASGAADPSQAKVQRKDSPAQPVQYTGTARPTAAPGAARLSQPTTTTVPYRGTAAPSAKPANAVAKKPTAPASTAAAPRKATPPAPRSVPKPAPAASASTTAAPASKPKGYLALLQKAKEKDSSKPAASPVTVASKGFIPTKKERLALKAEANAAKGKKPGVAPTVKVIDVKSDLSKISRKPADVGYQGTARPAKTAAPIAYKGTARPQSTTAPSSRGGTPAAKPKAKTEKGRYDGYADWSDLDDMDDGEDDYASDGSSDMEGGMWDVEKEEQEALKMARKEDAEALAEEMRLKREKEEKKRKLMTLSKAAAAKKKY